MHENELRAQGRLAASRASVVKTLVDMLGTDIAYYNGEDRVCFMLAKRFTALSFGCSVTMVKILMWSFRDGDQSHDSRFSVRFTWPLNSSKHNCDGHGQ
jgi:hypothetical protein